MIKSIGINGYTIGRTTTIAITEASGFAAPAVQGSLYYLSGRHGAKNPNSYWRERNIVLEISIRGSSLSDYVTKRDAVIEAFALPTNGEAVMTIETIDGRELQMTVQLRSIDGPFKRGEISHGSLRVELVCVDPFIESQDESSQEISLPIVAGAAIPTEIPLSLAYGAGAGETITITGNGIAYPVITIVGPCVNPVIKNDTTGEELQIEGDFDGSDSIVIDMEAQTVMQNLTTNLLDDTTGDFWALFPGANLILFSSATYDAAALATVVWRDAWIGI